MKFWKFITQILAAQAIVRGNIADESDRKDIGRIDEDGQLNSPYSERFLQHVEGDNNRIDEQKDYLTKEQSEIAENLKIFIDRKKFGDVEAHKYANEVLQSLNALIEINPSEENYAMREILHDELDTADMLHNRGREHHKTKDYDSALEDYNLAMSHYPNKQWVNFDIAMIFKERRDYSKAIEYFNKEEELGNNHYYNYDYRSWCYSRIGKFEEALADRLKAIELAPKENGFSYLAAEISHKLGLKEMALEYVTKEIEINPKFEYSNFKIDILQSLGRHEEVIAEVDNVFETYPERTMIDHGRELGYNSKLYFKKAVSHHALGDDEKSLDALNEAIKIKPRNNDEAYELRSYINYSLGNYGEALLDYERANGYRDFVIGFGALYSLGLLGLQKINNNKKKQQARLNETYSEEDLEGSLRSYTEGQLRLNVTEFDDLSAAEKNHFLNFDKENFKKIFQDVFDILYDCSFKVNSEVVDGQEVNKVIGKFFIGKFNENPFHVEEISDILNIEEGATDKVKHEIAKTFVQDKVKAYCKSYLQEKILSDVTDGEDNEFLANILMNCLDDSHRQNLILTYDLREGRREKNVLYDFVAKSQDYTVVDRQKLAAAKGIYRKTAVDYFCGIYDEIVEERPKSESHFDTVEEEKKKEGLDDVPKIAPSPLTASNVVGNVTQLGC
ncbi:MAG: hypothetical protein KGQ36_06565 [Rickettsiales bacterium]|nr:hypothetical protein [Rickettsiales bacterium]